MVYSRCNARNVMRAPGVVPNALCSCWSSCGPATSSSKYMERRRIYGRSGDEAGPPQHTHTRHAAAARQRASSCSPPCSHPQWRISRITQRVIHDVMLIPAGPGCRDPRCYARPPNGRCVCWATTCALRDRIYLLTFPSAKSELASSKSSPNDHSHDFTAVMRELEGAALYVTGVPIGMERRVVCRYEGVNGL